MRIHPSHGVFSTGVAIKLYDLFSNCLTLQFENTIFINIPARNHYYHIFIIKLIFMNIHQLTKN